MTSDFKPQLGRLARPEGKSAVAVIPSAGIAPVRPAEVHNIERDAADTNMYGNDVWGDCVFVMIEKDRVISAEALGVAITKLTPQQVINNYCHYNGIGTDPNVDAPGPGANILDALKWAQNHPEYYGGSKLLFYGDVPINEESAKQAVAEFASICVGVVVYKAMEYPAKVWYNGPSGPRVGGHGIAGGSYTSLADFIKTWGYMASVNSNGFDTIDELVVCVWDFQWNALTYDRQVACIASYEWVTGKTWTGPAPEDNMISRLSGADRFAVAAAVSSSKYSKGAATVYVANGAAYSDIACAATAAAAAGAPLLLVDASDIPAATAAELTRLAPHSIIVVGGPASVTAAVYNALGGYAK